MLEALARAINLALNEARTTPYRRGSGSVATDHLTIEVEALARGKVEIHADRYRRSCGSDSRMGGEKNVATNARSLWLCSSMTHISKLETDVE